MESADPPKVPLKDAEMCLTVRKLDGAEIDVQTTGLATVRDFKVAVAASAPVGAFAFRLVEEESGTMLEPDTAVLSDLGLKEGDVCMMLVGRVLDFVTPKVLKTRRHPQGVLVNDQGELLVCSYYSWLQIFDRDYELLREASLPGSHPCQMALAPSGELLIAFAQDPNRVGVFGLEDLKLKRWIGEESNQHVRVRGLAVAGDRMFMSNDRLGEIYVYSLTTDELLSTWKPGGENANPCGLAMLDNRLLAVADRRNNCVRLLDLEGNLVRDIGQGDSPEGLSKLSLPNDVAVDTDGNLIVMDTKKERLVVFQEDGTFVAEVMPGFFKNHGNTFSYVSVNPVTGAISVSNDDEHCVAVLAPV